MTTSLAELVAAERERQGLSLRAVAERSEGWLTSSTVHAIETGARQSVTDETLDGLSKALGLPLGQLQEAAGLPAADLDTPFVLPRRASRLTRKERELVLGMVDALLEARKRR